VVRCHTKLDWRENQAGRHTPGWLELGRLIAALIVQYPGARQRAGEALDLHERDVWLLRWLAAGMPVEGLHGQPKQWDFELADAAPLADRIAASVRMRTPTEAVDDDMRYSQAGQDLRDAYKDRPPPLEEDDEEHPF
jgi:hypothetical protein